MLTWIARLLQRNRSFKTYEMHKRPGYNNNVSYQHDRTKFFWSRRWDHNVNELK